MYSQLQNKIKFCVYVFTNTFIRDKLYSQLQKRGDKYGKAT